MGKVCSISFQPYKCCFYSIDLSSLFHHDGGYLDIAQHLLPGGISFPGCTSGVIQKDFALDSEYAIPGIFSDDPPGMVRLT